MQQHKNSETMKRILVLVMMFSALVAGAQENAQYRITYDCDAQYGSQRQVYRWHLDIGTENAVFYNPSNRGREQVVNEVTSLNDVTAVMERLNSIKTQFPNPNPLEVFVSIAPGSKYTYRNEVGSDKLWYEEERPALSWEMTDRDSTVCGYACLQAKTRLYGRDWTVWFAPEIPLSYGPYILGGLPGLILDAEDADELFHFTAVGLEQNPANAQVALMSTKDGVKCTRSKYLTLREKANGQSLNERLREMGIDDKTVVKMVSADGQDIDMDAERPKNNYLDLE